MRVFVAGASGFLGHAIVRALALGHHEVWGLHRSQEGQYIVSAAGGKPVRGNLTNPGSYEAAISGADVVIHAASAHPVMSLADPLSVMRQVRVEGGKNLLSAAIQHRVKRFVAISGYLVYGDHPGVITEKSPKVPRFLSNVNYEVEGLAREAHASGAIETVTAQPGMVYGNGSWFAGLVEEVRQGTFRYIEKGSYHWSLVHLSDVGQAVRLLSEKGVSGEEYLVVDDAPVTVRALADRVAAELGAPKPTGMTLAQATKEMGADLAQLNSNDQRASNAKLKALGWNPRYPTLEEGLPPMLSEMTG